MIVLCKVVTHSCSEQLLRTYISIIFYPGLARFLTPSRIAAVSEQNLYVECERCPGLLKEARCSRHCRHDGR